jgi:hypothetical protein
MRIIKCRGQNSRPTKRIIVRDVGCQTTDFCTGACSLEDLTEQLSGGGDVGGPSKPSCVSSIEVQPNVRLLKLGNSVRNEGFISILRVGAFFIVADIGDQVGKPVRFDNEDNANGGIHYGSPLALWLNENRRKTYS